MNKTKMPDKEIRTFAMDNLELRQDEETKKRTIAGHAAVFNTIDGPDFFRERINPGAFAESLEADDIRALFNHNPDLILGRNKSETLRLREDETGLHMEIDVPDTTVGRDLLESVARGDISQASFAFQTIDASWDTVDGTDVRTLEKVRLFDVSPVTYPFYEATDVALRTKQNMEKEREENINRNMNRRRKRIQVLRHT